MKKGVSVFEIDANGLPRLDNLQLASTLSVLLENGSKAYNVKGKEIAKGNDGEPLIGSTKNEALKQIRKTEYVNHIINTLKKNYVNVSGKRNDDKGTINTFWNEAGEEVVTYKGLTFKNPRKGFNTNLGYSGTNKHVSIRKQYFTEKEISLKDYVKSKKIKTSKYTSKKGKNMISYTENGKTVSYTEEQFNNKKITDYVEEWR